jgi:hypothetical protein
VFEGLFVHKTWNRKIIAHRDLRWSIAFFALSLGLLFMGSSSAIFAQGERRNQRREIHKPRPEISREAYNRRPKKESEAYNRRPKKESEAYNRRPKKESEAYKRRPEKEGEAYNRRPEKERENRKRLRGTV